MNKADANYVPLIRHIGALTIRYQAYTVGMEKFDEVLKELLILQEHLENEYPALRSMFDNGFKRNEAVRDKNNTSRD